MILKCVMLLYCLAVANAGVIETAYAPTPAVSTSPVVSKTVTPVSSKTIITPGAPVYETIVTTHESNHTSSDGSSFSKTLDTSYSQTDKFEPLSQVYRVPSFRPVSSYGDKTLVGAKVFPIIKTVSPTFVYPDHGPVLTNTIYHQDFSFGQSTPLHKSVFPFVTKSISPPVVLTPPVLTKTVTPIINRTDIVTPIFSAQATPDHKTVTPVLTKTIFPYFYHPHVVTKTISPVVYNPHIVTNTPVLYNPPVVTKAISPIVYNPHLVTKTISPVVYNPHVVTKKVVSPATITQPTPVKTGIAYSDAAVVSHVSFNGLGASYAW